MTQYAGDLILGCRRDTNNTDTTSISDEDFLRYLNFGQENAQAIILQSQSAKFQNEVIFNIIADQEAYYLPENTYMGDRVVNVEYSYTGEERDYHPIYERGLKSRSSYPQSYITSYIRRDRAILVQPLPDSSQGYLRVTCERQADRLELRRGIVTASTVTLGVLTALTVNIAGAYPPDSALVSQMLLTNPYLTVCTHAGEPTAYAIPVTAYAAGTGIWTISGGSFTLQDSTDTVDVGDYICFGKYSTTHTPLDPICERYMTAYCNWKICGRDTAGIKKAEYFETELKLIKAELMDSYSETDHDEDEIQIVNPDLL